MITGTLVSEVSYFCVYIFGESAGVEKTTTAACTSALQSLRNQLITTTDDRVPSRQQQKCVYVLP